MSLTYNSVSLINRANPAKLLGKQEFKILSSTNSNIQVPSNMNKAELIDLIQKNLGGETSKRAAGDSLEAVLQALAKGIKKDQSVQLIGFGTFKVAKRAARTGRNPKTGAAMKIKASKTVRFVPSSSLKGSL